MISKLNSMSRIMLNIFLIVLAAIAFVVLGIRFFNNLNREENEDSLVMVNEDTDSTTAESAEISSKNYISVGVCSAKTKIKTIELEDNGTVIVDNPDNIFITNGFNYTPTYEEMNMFCTVVSSETGYCEDKVQKAVAHTIINRLKSDQFPNTLEEIVTQRNQYTAVHSYFDGDYRVGVEPMSDAWYHTMNLIYEAIEEDDFTNGAVAYYNPYMKGYNDWFEQFTLTYEDEYGRFFVV